MLLTDKKVGDMNIWELFLALFIVNIIVNLIFFIILKLLL